MVIVNNYVRDRNSLYYLIHFRNLEIIIDQLYEHRLPIHNFILFIVLDYMLMTKPQK